jgi:Tfp pilus assembly protein PilF
MIAIRIIVVVFSILIASCAVPTIDTEQYHGETNQSQASSGPVAELQRLAIRALNEQQLDQAVGYLQRAIKIEPRNALSWHYLAQSYWHKKDYSHCLDMIERAYSYSSVEDDLDRANAALKIQCQAN